MLDADWLCEQDIIILPEEAEYKKVDTGREGERVYLLEIGGNRRFFYWMQDKSLEKDEVRSLYFQPET